MWNKETDSIYSIEEEYSHLPDEEARKLAVSPLSRISRKRRRRFSLRRYERWFFGSLFKELFTNDRKWWR